VSLTGEYTRGTSTTFGVVDSTFEDIELEDIEEGLGVCGRFPEDRISMEMMPPL
jgi:hypothetical protein